MSLVFATATAKEFAMELGKLFSELQGARRESRTRVAEYCDRLASALSRMNEAFAKGEVPYEAGHEFRDSMGEFRSVLYQAFREGSTRGEDVIGRLSARLVTLLAHAEGIDWHYENRRADEPPAEFKKWTSNMQRAAGDLRGMANRLRAV